MGGPAFRRSGAPVPEPQAEVQAELMAEAFGFYADNILTKDHFEGVVDSRFGELRAQMDQRFAEQDAKFDKRFAEQNAKFEGRFGRLERASFLHTWMLGILVVVMVIPQLQAWLV